MKDFHPGTRVRVLPSPRLASRDDRELVGMTGVIQQNLPSLKPGQWPFDWIVETLCIVDLDTIHPREDGTVVTQLWLLPRELEAVGPATVQELEPRP